MLVILLLAAATFLYRLGSLPAGFLDAEAANGLLARAASGHGSLLFADAGSRSPVLAALIELAGRPFGFDVLTARLGAAIAGMGTALLSALWLRRFFGPGWGVAGGLIVAGSFWLLVFSRVALSPVSGAFAFAALLCLLVEARARGGRNAALVWYAAAGVAAGLGVMSSPVLRILPLLLLVALGLAAWEQRRNLRQSEVIGLFVTLLAASITIGPFVRHAFDTPSLLGFWTPTADLPGATISSPDQLLRGYGLALARLVWPWPGALGLNLPHEPLLGPFVLPWSLIGLVVAARNWRNRLVQTALVWGLLLLLPAATITTVHPGRLLDLLPLLVALPVAGMRFVADRAGTRVTRIGVITLVILMLAGNAAWSNWRYFHDWVRADATSQAISASVPDSLHAAAQLPGDEPVLYSNSGHDDLVRYLDPRDPASNKQRRRFDFDGGHFLPIPAAGAGYLVAPQTTPVDPALLAFLGTKPLPELSGTNYQIYRVDQRARDELPLAIPTTPFSDGTIFLGHQLTATADGKLSIVLAWQLPENANAHSLRLRLRPVAGSGPTQTVDASLPGNLLAQPYDLLRLVHLNAPANGVSADLSVQLLDAQGHPLTTSGLDPDGYLFLNRYTFNRP
jgi:4-amino-4-deoxy-L-arabinose transferase-like glycosyltransferase